MATASVTQVNVRIYADDNADPDSLTPLGDQNATVERQPGTAGRFIARVLMQNSSSALWNSACQWQYRHKPSGGSYGAWTTLNAASSYVQTTGGTPAADALCDTSIITGGTGTFETDGTYNEDDGAPVTPNIAKNNYAEFAICVYLVSADVATGDEVQLRLSGTAITSETNYPTITVGAPSSSGSGSPSLAGFLTCAATAIALIVGSGSPSLTLASSGAGTVPANEEQGTLFACGFEDEDASFANHWSSLSYGAGNSLDVQDTTKRSGTFAASIAWGGTNNTAYAYKSVTISGNDIWYRCYFNVGSLTVSGTGQYVYAIQLFDGASAAAGIMVDRDGSNNWRPALRLDAGFNTYVDYGSYGDIVSGTWHRLEIHWKENATTGGVEAWIDGTLLGSDFTRDTSGWVIDSIRIGSAAAATPTGGTYYFDDARAEESGPIGGYNEGVNGSGSPSLPSLASSGAGESTIEGTGTPSLTLASTGAGTVEITGSGSDALPGLSSTAAGTVEVQGSGADTLPGLSASGTGTAEIQGTGSDALPGLSVTSAGTVDVQGTGADTLPSLTASGAGTADVQGTGSPALPTLTSTGTGESTIEGSGSPSMPSLTSSGTGSIGDVPISGSGAPTLPSLASSAAGTVAVDGTGSPTLPSLAASGTAEAPVQGSGADALPALASTGAGTVDVDGTGSPALPSLTSTGAGVVVSGITGSGTPSLPALAASGTGVSTIEGSGTPSLPSLASTSSGTVDVDGSGSPALPALQASGTGTTSANITGSGNPSLPALSVTASGIVPAVGTGSGALPSLACASSGTVEASGIGSATLPNLASSGTGVSTIEGTGAASLTLQATGTGAIPLEGTGAGTLAIPSLTSAGVVGVPDQRPGSQIIIARKRQYDLVPGTRLYVITAARR